VALVAKNAARHISSTISSLLNQTFPPSRIIVVNDGSSDNTHNLVTEFAANSSQVKLVDLPESAFDIRRVPSNLNIALQMGRSLPDEFLMISGDDCTYPDSYVESILHRMTKRVVVASGTPSHVGLSVRERTPSGSGRIIRSSFMNRVGFRFPIRAGWEAWLLYRANQEGCQYRLYDDVVYEHVRPRGTSHRFIYWGAAMHTLGYHPLYATGRIVRSMLKQRPPSSALGLLVGYLDAKLGSSDPFMAPFEPEFRGYVRYTQRQEISRTISRALELF